MMPACRDRFKDDRGEGGGTLEEDRVLEALQGAPALLLLAGRVVDGAIEEGAEEVHDAEVPLSLGQRRGSPVRLIDVDVPPW